MTSDPVVPNRSGIYKWRNLVNGKIYIDSTISFRYRKAQHIEDLNDTTKKPKNRYFRNAWIEYGEENFVFEIIEYCARSFLLGREQYYLDLYRSYDREIGYNICLKAGSSLGIKRSEEFVQKMWERKVTDEQKARMSEAQKLRYINHPASAESNEKRSISLKKVWNLKTDEEKEAIRDKTRGENNPRYGKSITDENRENLRKSHIGQSSPTKGTTMSDETKKKISESKNGKPWSEARRAAHIPGKKHSEEACKKKSEAGKLRRATEDTKQKLRDAWVKRKENKNHDKSGV